MAKLVFLGRLEDLAGTAELSVELRGSRSLVAVLEKLPDSLQSALISPKVRVAVNGRLVAADRLIGDVPIDDADEIAFLPPVSGG